MRNFFQRQGKFRPRDDDERGDQTIPEDLWVKCPKCGELIYSKELERNAHVCPKCNHHFRLRARERIRLLADPGGFEEWDASLQPVDPLGFVDGQGPYPEKVAKTQAKTGEVEALITGLCRIEGRPLVLVVADFDFLGASMGSVWGEKLTRAASARWSTAGRAHRQCLGRRPHARGILSLMQMAKTVAAFHRLGEARLPHFSLLVDPCYGGVTASYATVADVVMASRRADRLRRAAGDRADHQAEAARRLPDRRVPAGAWHDRLHRRAIQLRQQLGTLIDHYLSANDRAAGAGN